jgi:hypothetical protein
VESLDLPRMADGQNQPRLQLAEFGLGYPHPSSATMIPLHLNLDSLPLPDYILDRACMRNYLGDYLPPS